MKRKVVMKMLCVSIASAMLVANTAVLAAGEGSIRTAIYNGKQLTVTVTGDVVILPDGKRISIKDCKLLEETTENQDPSGSTGEGTENSGTPDTEVPGGTETPDKGETPDSGAADGNENPDSGTPGEGETPDSGTTDENETPDSGAPGEGEAPDTERPGEAETPDAGAPDQGETVKPAVPTQKPASDTSAAARPEEKSTIAQSSKSKTTPVPQLNPIKPSLKAGIGFYVNELKDTYHIEFDEKFAEMTAEIETEYTEAVLKEAVEVKAAEVKAAEAQNVSEEPEGEVAEQQPETAAVPVSKVKVAENVTLEELRAEELKVSVDNWQDVTAVYLLEQLRAGATEFKLDENSKGRLAELVNEMNIPTITEDEVVCEPQFIGDYIEANKDNLSDNEKEFLEKYTSSNFKLLCSAATGAKGLIKESLGEDISAERTQVVASAYSLIGKIPYFWGGKSTVVGWDDRWGSPAQVTAAGTDSSGTIQNYGLDCSGFITWSFVNGYENSGAASLVGHGTATQWAMSKEIDEEEAQPGDLVFLQQPNSAGINHVGIVVGRNDDGSLIAVHCNAGKNGVTVDSAYQAGFRYVRRPLAYCDDETEEMTGTQARLQKLKAEIAEENEKEAEKTDRVQLAASK